MIVTIARQLGSGGREIGRLLSDRMGLAYYDRELIQAAARESGICVEQFERNDERKNFVSHFFSGIRPHLWGEAIHLTTGLTPETLFLIQSNAIRSAAQAHDCLFVGRCADYILRDRHDCLTVFISADPADRIKRICSRHNFSEKQAQAHLARADRERAAYYNFYTEKCWGVASHYHICINSSVLGIDGTVDLLEHIVKNNK
jgi:cytidylate kinase